MIDKTYLELCINQYKYEIFMLIILYKFSSLLKKCKIYFEAHYFDHIEMGGLFENRNRIIAIFRK